MVATPTINTDVLLIFIVKSLRNFSYGALSVPIILYLELINLSHEQIGVLMTLSLIGNLVLCLVFASHADKLGRKNVMLICSIMKFIAGGIFSFSRNIYLLIFGGIIGTISLSGTQMGPFLSVQQAILSDTVPNDGKDSASVRQHKIACLMGWYNSFGFIFNALGAGFVGVLIAALQKQGWGQVSSYRMVILIYSFIGFISFILYLLLSKSAQAPLTQQQPPTTTKQILMLGFSSSKSFKIMMILGLLFAIDSFAGQLIPNSFISYWYHINWDISIKNMAIILMINNIISGVGALFASYFVKHFGLINVIIFTHIPCNILSILIPIMPNKELSLMILLLKGFTCNMNVSSKQTYLLFLVDSSEKSAAGSLFVNSKALGQIFSAFPVSLMMDNSSFLLKSLPFVLSGAIRMGSDLSIWLFDKKIGAQIITTQEQKYNRIGEDQQPRSSNDKEMREISDDIENRREEKEEKRELTAHRPSARSV